MPIICEAVVTNARIATLRFASRALVTSGNGFAASAAGFRLRLGGGRCAPTPFPPSLRLRSMFPLADRRPKPRQTVCMFAPFQYAHIIKPC